VEKIISTIYFKLGLAIPVALSPEVLSTIVSFYGLTEEKVPMIYNGVDLGKCCPKEDYALAKPAYLLHIGRFNAQKNHKGLLEAFSQIIKAYPDCCLNLIGDGELEGETLQYADSLGLREKINFLGNQTNVYTFLQKADLFLLPSRFEGMPMTIIEAMGTGLPIVASQVGGVPDMLEDGNSGLLVSCDPDAVAQAVLQLLQQECLREKLGKNALQASKIFGADHMARCYFELYTK
jgi:glycosyltransferase involved in cell wall biosynthesis